jgi:hypothetical protein
VFLSSSLVVILLQLWQVLAEDYQGPWRNSVEGDPDSCWRSSVADCNRVMSIVHGGDWNVQYPYDSLPAMQAVFSIGSHNIDRIIQLFNPFYYCILHFIYSS